MNLYSKLEGQDVTNSGRLFRILLAPIWLLLEYLCYRKYWHKILIPELITNDNIFDFLDKNEFEYRKNKLIKKDLVEDYEKLNGRTESEIKQIIKADYVEALVKLISENCSTNIEDFLNLQVIVETEIREIDGEYFRASLFTVIIQFHRLWWLQKAKKYTLIWTMLVLLIILISTFIITYIK